MKMDFFLHCTFFFKCIIFNFIFFKDCLQLLIKIETAQIRHCFRFLYMMFFKMILNIFLIFSVFSLLHSMFLFCFYLSAKPVFVLRAWIHYTHLNIDVVSRHTHITADQVSYVLEGTSDLICFSLVILSNWGKYNQTSQISHTHTHTLLMCQFRTLHANCMIKCARPRGVCMRMCVCLDKCLFSDMLSSPHSEPCYVVFNNTQANSTLTRAWKLNDYLPFAVCVFVCACASAPMGLQSECECEAYLYFFNACVWVLVCHRVCPVCANQCVWELMPACFYESLSMFSNWLWTFFSTNKLFSLLTSEPVLSIWSKTTVCINPLIWLSGLFVYPWNLAY